jgi:flagellin
MSMTINTNINSLNAQRNLGVVQNSLSASMQRLSSGLRINSAKDDAAGLAISDRMTSQVMGLNVAVRNGNDAISLTQVAEGALGTIGDMMQRMRELAVQAANGTNGATDLAALDAEYGKLKTAIGSIADQTKFNGLAIIGTAGATGSGTFTFQVGANSGDTTTVATVDAKTYTTALGSLSSTTAASTEIGLLDTALSSVASARGDLGAAQNTIQFTLQNLQNASVNTSAARSRVLDADFATETANLSRSQILQQAGTAMVAQANQLPQGVLALLR